LELCQPSRQRCRWCRGLGREARATPRPRRDRRVVSPRVGQEAEGMVLVHGGRSPIPSSRDRARPRSRTSDPLPPRRADQGVEVGPGRGPSLIRTGRCDSYVSRSSSRCRRAIRGAKAPRGSRPSPPSPRAQRQLGRTIPASSAPRRSAATPNVISSFSDRGRPSAWSEPC
jgi:hypothetical protein